MPGLRLRPHLAKFNGNSVRPAECPICNDQRRRAGHLTDAQWLEVEAGIARSHGTCMTMGTASTMTAIAEAIGMTLPGASSIPAADANHIRMS